MSLRQERANLTRTCYRSEELRAFFSHSLRLMRIEACRIPQIIRVQEARSSVCDLVNSMNNGHGTNYCILLCSMYNYDHPDAQFVLSFTLPTDSLAIPFHWVTFLLLNAYTYIVQYYNLHTDWCADARGERLGATTRRTRASWLDLFWIVRRSTSAFIFIQIAIFTFYTLAMYIRTRHANLALNSFYFNFS